MSNHLNKEEELTMATVVYDENTAYFGACSECGHAQYVNITNEHWTARLLIEEIQ